MRVRVRVRVGVRAPVQPLDAVAQCSVDVNTPPAHQRLVRGRVRLTVGFKVGYVRDGRGGRVKWSRGRDRGRE